MIAEINCHEDGCFPLQAPPVAMHPFRATYILATFSWLLTGTVGIEREYNNTAVDGKPDPDTVAAKI